MSLFILVKTFVFTELILFVFVKACELISIVNNINTKIYIRDELE